MEKAKVEVGKEIVDELFRMAKMKTPEVVNDEALLEALLKIKTQEIPAAPLPLEEEINAAYSPVSNNILVIDDIGVVTYQLKILLSNLGYSVQVAKDIFSGLNTFVKSNYAYVIMDLFVSTEQEGFTLLNETKKIITKNNLETKIIVITASSKAENKVKCLNGGADIFIKKETGWQDKLVEIIMGNLKKE